MGGVVQNGSNSSDKQKTKAFCGISHKCALPLPIKLRIMVEKFNQEAFERLKKEVEVLVGRSIKSPKDFDFLSRQIYGYTRENISVSTLKRMWGYVACASKPSRFNLNLLSRMVGYPSWAAFIGGGDGEDSSHFFVKSKLVAGALEVGERVKLTWNPGRILILRYQGNDVFLVEESVKSKLFKGDIFTCHQFVDSEPLYLSNLQHPDIPLCNYVAGKNGGIKWNIIEE